MFSKDFIECQIELIGADDILCCFNDSAIEFNDWIGAPKKVFWNLPDVGIQADAEETVVLLLDGPKFLVKEHCVPVT
jgi:hypothetical protein